jgi:hypothetical protein
MEGKKIKIINMVGEPQYRNRIGTVVHVDSLGQIHGTWGGCAIIPEVDTFRIIDEMLDKAYEKQNQNK